MTNPDTGVALPPGLLLLVEAGPDQGMALVLESGRFLVGTGPDCHLRLRDEAVAGRHLEVLVSHDYVQLRDLGSKNGSYHRGARFDLLRVGACAQITIGTTSLALATAADLSRPAYRGERFGRVIGRAPPMLRLFASLDRLARGDAAVLIVGETGTGKDLLAQELHERSRRAGGPFVVCDLAGLPGAVVEVALFGHAPGAFTVDSAERASVLENATGGTLFLDEIGELAPPLQPRFLRMLETGSVKRLGDSAQRSFDVRVVAATARDLAAEVQAQRFRADLFQRLAASQVRVPPLRERLEDLPLLIVALLDDLERRDGHRLNLPPETIAALATFSWPGNMRQLRDVIEQAGAAVPVGSEVRPEVLSGLVQRWEQDYVAELLKRCHGNIAQAARECGIDRGHLYRHLRKHGVDRPEIL